MAIVREILTRLATAWGEPAEAVTLPVILCIAAGLGAQFIPKPTMEKLQAGFGRMHPALQGAALALVLFAVDVLGADGVAAFIYFQF
jgi:hypothetical protein